MVVHEGASGGGEALTSEAVTLVRSHLPWAELQGLSPEQRAFQQTHPAIRQRILNGLRGSDYQRWAGLNYVHQVQSQVDRLRAEQGRPSPYAHPAQRQPWHNPTDQTMVLTRPSYRRQVSAAAKTPGQQAADDFLNSPDYWDLVDKGQHPEHRETEEELPDYYEDYDVYPGHDEAGPIHDRDAEPRHHDDEDEVPDSAYQREGRPGIDHLLDRITDTSEPQDEEEKYLHQQLGQDGFTYARNGEYRKLDEHGNWHTVMLPGDYRRARTMTTEFYNPRTEELITHTGHHNVDSLLDRYDINHSYSQAQAANPEGTHYPTHFHNWIRQNPDSYTAQEYRRLHSRAYPGSRYAGLRGPKPGPSMSKRIFDAEMGGPSGKLQKLMDNRDDVDPDPHLDENLYGDRRWHGDYERLVGGRHGFAGGYQPELDETGGISYHRGGQWTNHLGRRMPATHVIKPVLAVNPERMVDRDPRQEVQYFSVSSIPGDEGDLYRTLQEAVDRPKSLANRKNHPGRIASASTPPLSWDAIGDLHPSIYGDPEVHGEAAEGADGNGIGWAASHLAFDRPGHGEDYRDEGSWDLDFHLQDVPVNQIDYARAHKSDHRVQRARQGYRETPDLMPPPVLVHRHGVFQVADGHHRGEAASLEGLETIPAYVAQSPYEDEPFSDGTRAPYHGARAIHLGAVEEGDTQHGLGQGHTAPAAGPTMDDPEDYLPNVYEHPEYYIQPHDHRDPLVHASGMENWRALKAVRGNPDAMVQIYRAVPHGVTRIEGNTNPAGASWVSASPSYAKRHAEAESCPSCGGDMQVISGLARAGDLHNEGYLEEWGYTGDPIKDDSALTECPEGAYEARKAAEAEFMKRHAAADLSIENWEGEEALRREAAYEPQVRKEYINEPKSEYDEGTYWWVGRDPDLYPKRNSDNESQLRPMMDVKPDGADQPWDFHEMSNDEVPCKTCWVYGNRVRGESSPIHGPSPYADEGNTTGPHGYHPYEPDSEGLYRTAAEAMQRQAVSDEPEFEMPQAHKDWLSARGWTPRVEPPEGETFAPHFTKMHPAGIRHSLYWDGKKAYDSDSPVYQLESTVPDKTNSWRNIRPKGAVSVFESGDLNEIVNRSKENERAWLSGEGEDNPGLLHFMRPEEKEFDNRRLVEPTPESSAGSIGDKPFVEPKERLHPLWRGGPDGRSGLHRLNSVVPDESGLKAAGIAVIALDTGRVLMQQRALNPLHCPCGLGVTWDEQNGYQHDDGSVNHDGEFYGQSVSDLLDQGHGVPCTCCLGTGEDEQGSECTSCDGAGVNPEPPFCGSPCREEGDDDRDETGLEATAALEFDPESVGFDPLWGSASAIERTATHKTASRTVNLDLGGLGSVVVPDSASGLPGVDGRRTDAQHHVARTGLDSEMTQANTGSVSAYTSALDGVAGMVHGMPAGNLTPSRKIDPTMEVLKPSINVGSAITSSSGGSSEKKTASNRGNFDLDSIREQGERFGIIHAASIPPGLTHTGALEYDINEGRWEWPGGKLDPGESPRAAAIREFVEEVGQPLPPGVFVGAWLAPGGISVSAAGPQTPAQIAAQQWLDENAHDFTYWTGSPDASSGRYGPAPGYELTPEAEAAREREQRHATLAQHGWRHIEGSDPTVRGFFYKDSPSTPGMGQRLTEPTPWQPYWKLHQGPARLYGQSESPVGMHQNLEDALANADYQEQRLSAPMEHQAALRQMSAFVFDDSFDTIPVENDDTWDPNTSWEKVEEAQPLYVEREHTDSPFNPLNRARLSSTDGPFYHGTVHSHVVGDEISPEHSRNYFSDELGEDAPWGTPVRRVFFTRDRDAAARYGHLFRVEPTGPFSEHPWEAGTLVSAHPLRVVEKVESKLGKTADKKPVYKGFIYLVQNERDIDLGNRAIANPDDPDGDMSEQSAWWDIADAKKNPALREEVKKSTPWAELELWADKSVRTNRKVVAAVDPKYQQAFYNWLDHEVSYSPEDFAAMSPSEQRELADGFGDYIGEDHPLDARYHLELGGAGHQKVRTGRPGTTVRVLRVEKPDGTGPFGYGGDSTIVRAYEEATDSDLYSLLNPNHEDDPDKINTQQRRPQADKIPERYIRGRVFGFLPQHRVTDYFTPRMLQGLHERGFGMSEYDVPGESLVLGRTQAAWRPEDATLVSHTPLTEHISKTAAGEGSWQNPDGWFRWESNPLWKEDPRWPEESSRRPSKTDWETGVVQPMVDLKYDDPLSEAGDGEDIMVKNWKPSDAPHPLHHMAMPRDENYLNSLNYRFEPAEANKWGPGEHSIWATSDGNSEEGWISWHPETGTILNIDVFGDGRKGLATELLRRAKKVSPELRHSRILLDDGRSLIRSLGDEPGGPVLQHEAALPSDGDGLSKAGASAGQIKFVQKKDERPPLPPGLVYKDHELSPYSSITDEDPEGTTTTKFWRWHDPELAPPFTDAPMGYQIGEGPSHRRTVDWQPMYTVKPQTDYTNAEHFEQAPATGNSPHITKMDVKWNNPICENCYLRYGHTTDEIHHSYSMQRLHNELDVPKHEFKPMVPATDQHGNFRESSVHEAAPLTDAVPEVHGVLDSGEGSLNRVVSLPSGGWIAKSPHHEHIQDYTSPEDREYFHQRAGEDADMEEFASRFGRAISNPDEEPLTPEVIRSYKSSDPSPTVYVRLHQDFKDMDAPAFKDHDFSAMKNSPRGKILGYFHSILSDGDKDQYHNMGLLGNHEDPDKMIPVSIDHTHSTLPVYSDALAAGDDHQKAKLLWGHTPTDISPFAEHFLMHKFTGVANHRIVPAPSNPLAPGDTERVQAALETMRPWARSRGREDWVNAAQHRASVLGQYGTGTESIFPYKMTHERAPIRMTGAEGRGAQPPAQKAYPLLRELIKAGKPSFTIRTPNEISQTHHDMIVDSERPSYHEENDPRPTTPKIYAHRSRLTRSTTFLAPLKHNATGQTGWVRGRSDQDPSQWKMYRDDQIEDAVAGRTPKRATPGRAPRPTKKEYGDLANERYERGWARGTEMSPEEAGHVFGGHSELLNWQEGDVPLDDEGHQLVPRRQHRDYVAEPEGMYPWDFNWDEAGDHPLVKHEGDEWWKISAA